MKEGHFHFHTTHVSRSKGGSSVAAAAYQSNQNLTHEQQKAASVDITHRKQLNKGIVTDDLRNELKEKGVNVSSDATAEKGKRRHWTITDGDDIYQVKEYTIRETDKDTGKQKVIARGLDVYADVEHDYTKKNDAIETWVQAPNNAPDWLKEIEQKGGNIPTGDRAELWNKVEQAAPNRDGRIA